jgi:GT2 family glycosyltransferase
MARAASLAPLPETPLVTVILAVRNEERHITRALDGVRLQDWPRECLEVLVVDGMSDDRTRDLVARIAERDARVRLLDNPGRFVAPGLNAGLAAARGQVIVRVDGHCRIGPGHVRRSVAELRAGAAECVGGPVRALGDTPLAEAIAHAMSTPFGVGGATFRYARSRCEVEHLPFGAWRREVFEWLGGFDESLVRNQDDEFSDRLRRAGGRIVLLPELLAEYFSRATLPGLWRQYLGYGFWKVRVIRKRGGWPSSPRHLVPAAFVLAMLASVALAAAGAVRAAAVRRVPRRGHARGAAQPARARGAAAAAGPARDAHRLRRRIPRRAAVARHALTHRHARDPHPSRSRLGGRSRMSPISPVPPLTILYCGTLNPGGTCLQRMQELQKLGHRVIAVDTVPGEIATRRSTLAWRVRNRLVGAIDESQANERLLALPATPAPDVLWFDKPVTIERATVLALRARWPDAIALTYSGDDMFNPRNQSRAWLSTMADWDLRVTTKSFNVSEFYAAGARDVFFVDKAFSPHVHRPMTLSQEERERFGGDVGFIGWPEGPRERSMRFLARHGIRVRVWGPWPRWKAAPNLRIEGRPLWGDDYARAINGFRITLGFLRRVNRDRHTTRSIEIPACGGFLLAERTEEHERLLHEGAEAEYFGSDSELLEKVRYYLAHEDARARIAAAGRERCLRDGYSNSERLTSILQYALQRRSRMLAA